MSGYSFDDWEDVAAGPQNRDPKPFWSINPDKKSSEESVLKWLKGEVEFLRAEGRDRIRQNEKNLQLLRGIQYETQEVRQAVRDRADDRSRIVQRIVINHLYDLTESMVSRAVKFKPAVSINPANDEYEDRISARMTKALLDHIWYEKQFRGDMIPKIVRQSKVFGECYLFIEWDKELGDEVDASRAAREKGMKVPLPDVKDPDGNQAYIDKPIKQGDVKYEIVLSNDIYLQKAREYDEVEYAFRRYVTNIEDLRRRYPEKAVKIEPELETQVFDFERMELRKLRNEAIEWRFYHKKTKELPGGRYSVFVRDIVLENGDCPYNHGEFPWERLTDIEYPGNRHGFSFFNVVKSMASVYNNLTNLIIRNQMLCSHPKWVMPAGACRLEQLGNDITIVQYKGPTPPQLIQMNPTPNEIFAFRDSLREEFSQISGVHGISRGEPPRGIKAGIALQFLDEQEHERSSSFNLKYAHFIKQVAKKTISVAAQFYSKADKRMIRVQGKNDAWMLEHFDVKHLHKSYDIRVENTNALPESRAARIQTILDLYEAMPDIFTPEQILDQLDLGQAQKFFDAGTVAVKAAEMETEMIIEGKIGEGKVSEGDDHILHWRTHYRGFQQYNFRELPDQIQNSLKAHQAAHEMLMFEKAKINPAFKQKLLMLDNFPLFYIPSNEDAAALQIMDEMAQGGPEAGAINPQIPIAQQENLQQQQTQPEPQVQQMTLGGAGNV